MNITIFVASEGGDNGDVPRRAFMTQEAADRFVDSQDGCYAMWVSPIVLEIGDLTSTREPLA